MCLFNLHAEHIMWNAELDELQAGIKIARRNINNLRYVDDTTLMAETEEELKSLLMRVKEEPEKAGLKLNIKENWDHGISPITSWQIEREKVEAVTDFLFLDSKSTVDGDCSHEIRRWLLLGRKAMSNLGSVLKSKDITWLIKVHIVKSRASLVAQLVKNPPAMQETLVWFLGWKMSWRREQLPTPVFWPGEFHGQRSPAGYSLLSCKESDTTVWFSLSHGLSSSHVQMWELDSEEGRVLKNWCFWLWCWRRFFRVPWTARRSNQSILKEINPEYSLEGLMLKFQYFGHLILELTH